MRVRTIGVVLVMATGMGLLPLGQPCLAAASSYVAPVDGPITRRFDPPLGPYAAGHRGIDFGVAAGSQVVASNSGTVTFAGSVASGLFVTLSHAGQISTTYSFLSQVLVQEGENVRRGQVIALSGPGHGDGDALHFGAKLVDTYIDPEILLSGDFDDISDVISLAPLDDPGGASGMLTTGGSGAFRPVSGFHVASSGPSKGWAVKLGEKIATAATAMTGFLSGLTAAVGGFFSSTWDLIADTGVTIWETTKIGVRKSGHAVSVGAKKTWRVTKRVASAVASAVKWSARMLVKGWRLFKSQILTFGRWTSHAAKSIWNFFREHGRALVIYGQRFVKIPDSFFGGVMAFIVGVIKGALKQVVCTVRGGAPAPAIGSKSLPPPNNNIVIAVAGIGSSTTERNGKIDANATIYEMDWASMGYKPEQIYNFSYKGVQDRGSNDPYRLHAPYSREETYKDIRDSAKTLSRQVEAIHAKFPGRKIDLVAHSQGGLVAAYFVTLLYDVDNPERLELGHLVTISSPHKGADAAQLGTLLADNPKALADLDALAQKKNLPPASAESAIQLSEGSTFIADLIDQWDPEKVKTTTIGASFDYVVTAPHTGLPGATHYTPDLTWNEAKNSHSQVVNANSTKQYLYSALADRQMACTAMRDALAEHGSGALISGIEDQIAHGIDFMAELTR